VAYGYACIVGDEGCNLGVRGALGASADGNGGVGRVGQLGRELP